MGGFSAQVQQPSNQSGGGKMGPGASVDLQAQQLDQHPNPNPDQGQPSNFGAPQQSPLAQYQQSSRPVGKGGSVTNSSTSGQPRIGMPNQYSNTVGQWDNTQIQPVQQHGKGKGG